MSQAEQKLAVVTAPRQDLAPATFETMERMADAFAKSQLFGLTSKDQALALMLVAQSEGLHPATVAQEYDIIKGKAARKTNSVLARFQAAGGRVEWHKLADDGAEATFTHPQGGSVHIDWDMARAKRTMVWEKEGGTSKKVALADRPMYKDVYPRAMFRARCIAEGVRAVWPAAIGGALVREEAMDPIEQPEKDITDQGEVVERQEVRMPQRKPQAAPAPTQPEPSSERAEEPQPATAPTIPGGLTTGMLKMVRAKIAAANENVGLTEDKVCEHFEVKALEEIAAAKVNDVIGFIANPG